MTALNGNHSDEAVVELDALIVGAGFGGVYQLKRLRDQGFRVKLVESGSDFGGVWYWNRYPGARVDSTIPHYEFSDPDLWKGWTWSQRFPGSAELRRYFNYVAKKWNLRKDTIFDTFITSAAWDGATCSWTVRAKNGLTFKSRFFLPNTGFAAKRHIPDWKGVDKFEGTFVHPSYWPKDEPLLRGKKVAVIGTGSTGVQLCQDLAPLASEFTLFQRTPNLAIPMKQVQFEGKEQAIPKVNYPALYNGRTQSFGGFNFSFLPIDTFDHDEEQRRATYQRLWDEGDFHFHLANYQDLMFDDDANTEAYNFWRDKVRARISDPRLQEKLAPEVKPHAFGCKRPSLENGFYELFNRPNVRLVDVNENPIIEVTPRGIKTADCELEFDYIVCATGFDAVTGGLLQMNIMGEDGISLNDKWKDGVKTYMGLCVAGFPNMFFTYGPQAPTALCNGPTCAEIQGEWIVNALEHMREHNLQRIEASVERERQWAQKVWTIAHTSLLPNAKSWYMGDNIPGKNRECLVYLGGVPTYHKTIHESASNAYRDFYLH